MNHKIIEDFLDEKVEDKDRKAGTDSVPQAFFCHHFKKPTVRNPHGPQNSEIAFSCCHKVLQTVQNMNQTDRKQDYRDSVEKTFSASGKGSAP